MTKRDSKTTNVEQLRNNLLDTYDQLRAGTIGLREAKEQANVAGKILSSSKQQLEYNAMMKSGKPIPFFETDEPEKM